MTITFFVVRILIFPFVYYIFARQRKMAIFEAAISIPLHCTLGTMALFSLQIYWFSQMISGVVKVLKNISDFKKHKVQ